MPSLHMAYSFRHHLPTATAASAKVIMPQRMACPPAPSPRSQGGHIENINQGLDADARAQMRSSSPMLPPADSAWGISRAMGTGVLPCAEHEASEATFSLQSPPCPSGNSLPGQKRQQQRLVTKARECQAGSPIPIQGKGGKNRASKERRTSLHTCPGAMQKAPSLPPPLLGKAGGGACRLPWLAPALPGCLSFPRSTAPWPPHPARSLPPARGPPIVADGACTCPGEKAQPCSRSARTTCRASAAQAPWAAAAAPRQEPLRCTHLAPDAPRARHPASRPASQPRRRVPKPKESEPRARARAPLHEPSVPQRRAPRRDEEANQSEARFSPGPRPAPPPDGVF